MSSGETEPYRRLLGCSIGSRGSLALRDGRRMGRKRGELWWVKELLRSYSTVVGSSSSVKSITTRSGFILGE